MALLSLRGVRYSVGGPALLDGVQLNIESGERVCLVGRNGEGKSTLMRLIAGRNAPEPIVPDGGDIIWQSSSRQAFLPQAVPPQLDGRAFDIVAQGLPEEERDQQHRVATYLTQLKIDGDQEFKTLSGGMQRRVMLARALASDADLLLLDEPTNHLDIESIAWLEEYLKRNVRALLFVTHDRAFLRSVATRIVEIDRGKLASFECTYDTYLDRKSALLDAEAKQQADFDKKLAQEEVWIRKGVKARETRNEGRVRALQKL
ncbi:MAG: transport system ATP-binding/permease protein, partial [Abditibacteriota bacterium]|nr:transport system ATP-binding/permease protein [Abditibacteriota bacterium]